MQDRQQLATVFKAFCDPKRLLILQQLRSGEKCNCVLTELCALKQSALSYHMKILCESGIVTMREEGKWTHYSICPEGGQKAQEMLKDILTLDQEQIPSEEFVKTYKGGFCQPKAQTKDKENDNGL